MRLVRVAGASLNQIPLDFTGNIERIKKVLRSANAENVDIVCLPELCITGYGCEDQFLSLGVSENSWTALLELLPHTKDLVVVFGLPVLFRSMVYNCAVVTQNGRILGINPKKILPREGIHYEQRWFHPWPRGGTAKYYSGNETIPFGDFHYRFGGIGVAIEICEEAWGSDSPSTAHVSQGVQFILNPSASHFAMGKVKVRERLVANWSRSQKVHYCYANMVGNEAGRIVYDGGVLLAEGGDIVKRGPRMNFATETMTSYDFDSDLATTARLCSYGVEATQMIEQKKSPVILGVDLANSKAQERLNPSKLVNAVHHTNDAKEPRLSLYEDFYRAVTLGLHDYMRKSHTKGFVVSLSGGIDSSVTAIMAAHAIAEGLSELGSIEMAERLGQPQLSGNIDPKAWVKATLICVYQATENSSDATAAAAKQIAENIGATFYHVNVSPVVQKYHELYTEMTGEALNWQEHDIPLQNIQARARGPLAWMLANTQNMLLLCTSNRSESAVGYATMDGDMAGGLAPLAGIDKQYLIGFLGWLGEQESFGLGSIAATELVLAQPPTAELRPKSSQQNDEDDLMPYPLIERIERLFVRDRMRRSEILRCLVVEFPKYSKNDLEEYILRFLEMWRSSQWKRERLAPSFHIDDESLDPKTWCRYPIFSGNGEI